MQTRREALAMITLLAARSDSDVAIAEVLPDVRSGIIGWLFSFHSVAFFFFIGGVLEDPVGRHPRAGCLFTDEYLMGLNGDLHRRSVALSFPTHTTGGFMGVAVRLCVHSGSPAPPHTLGGCGCFVLPCHPTAAFDFIIPVAGRAVKQTTGMKAEAPRSHPPPAQL